MLKRNYLLAIIFPIMFSSSEDPAIIKATDLMKRITNKSDTTYIINFWATWCGPCVKELPEFEKLNENYKGKKVKVLLVSMDFKQDYEKKLVKFIKRKKIRSEVVLLDETRPNEFIDKVNPRWQGSIPATMIVNNADKYNQFFERTLTYEFLEQKVKAFER